MWILLWMAACDGRQPAPPNRLPAPDGPAPPAPSTSADPARAGESPAPPPAASPGGAADAGPGAPYADPPAAEGTDSAEASDIAAVVKKSQPGVTTCIDGAMRSHPSLAGTVSAGWTITAGTVTEAHVVSNTTGVPSLGDCVLTVVKQMKFDPALSADIEEFPWVIKGK